MTDDRAAGLTYFPVGLDLRGRRVMVVGGNDWAVGKVERLIRAGARVELVWPTLGDELRGLAARGAIQWYARSPVSEDTVGCRVVYLIEVDLDWARTLAEWSRGRGFWLCCLDQPRFCDFVNVGVVEAGPVQVSISSNGRAPGLVRRLREDLQAAFDDRFAEFALRMASYRDELATAPFAEKKQMLDARFEGFKLEIVIHYPL